MWLDHPHTGHRLCVRADMAWTRGPEACSTSSIPFANPDHLFLALQPPHFVNDQPPHPSCGAGGAALWGGYGIAHVILRGTALSGTGRNITHIRVSMGPGNSRL